MIGNILRSLVPERYRPIGYLNHLVRVRTGLAVREGFFKGMGYIQDSVGSAYIPKLLGIYERELNSCVESLIERAPSLVVDVGAAEGYYAVGLARRLPKAQVIAFEMERHGQKALHAMAHLNNVSSRLQIRGRCEPSDLAQALGTESNAVVVCDVEGYEEILLDPIAVPALRNVAILVELHDFIIPKITETLKQRFGETHHISHIWQESRTQSDFPWRTLGTRLLPSSYLDWAVSEWRPVQMAWLWMQPHGISG